MAPSQDMEMKMKYGLAAMRAGVDDEPVSGIGNSLLFCDLVAGQHKTSEQPDVRFL